MLKLNAPIYTHIDDLGGAVWVPKWLLVELGIPTKGRSCALDLYRFDKRRWRRELRRAWPRLRWSMSARLVFKACREARVHV